MVVDGLCTFLDIDHAAEIAHYSTRHFRRLLEEDPNAPRIHAFPVNEGFRDKFFILRDELLPYIDSIKDHRKPGRQYQPRQARLGGSEKSKIHHQPPIE